ncbi:hypothetical protein HDK90DRAFT_493438 [Phyllosticta capitalensis]|uniref:Uncharacterized protein n=1 Tax=Phyllosticta capitalensis TaxID=121624 RepID=A0ABR1YGU9_9PEZI
MEYSPFPRRSSVSHFLSGVCANNELKSSPGSHQGTPFDPQFGSALEDAPRTCPTGQSPESRRHTQIQLPSNSAKFLQIQKIWESIKDDGSVRKAGPLIKEVRTDGFPLSFEPCVYKINPEAVAVWPSYGAERKDSGATVGGDAPADAPSNPAKRPSDSIDQSSDAKKLKVIPDAPAVREFGPLTFEAFVKEQERLECMTAKYSAWKQTEEGRKLGVDVEAFESIRGFILARIGEHGASAF